ncbi:MAG: tetratricopeptide repeat protein [Planctomyces sp.]
MVSLPLPQIIRGLSLLTVSALLAGCSSMGGNMANSSGMSYFERGNYMAAGEQFQRALASDPDNPDYMANLARVRMTAGDAMGAEQLYRQALTVQPSHQPAYHGLAELMVAQNRGQEATAMLSTWASSQPYNAEPQIELAWLQRELGNHQESGQALQKALQINPGNSTALAHLGQHYHDIGQPEMAVTMYQQSLRSDWNQPDIHARLANASQSAGASTAMGATAMGRGMHPGEIPRQQMAFGMPNGAGQFGPAAGPPGSRSAMLPFPQGSGSGWQPSPTPWVVTSGPAPTNASAMMPQNGQIIMNGDAGTMLPGTVTMPMTPGTPQPAPATASPVPDPAFSSMPGGAPTTAATVSLVEPF